MGAAASVNEGDDAPEYLTEAQVKELAGDLFDEGAFNAAAEDGKVKASAYEAKADEIEQANAATKIQARSRGRKQRAAQTLTGGEGSDDKSTKERIEACFKKFDKDGSGEIGYEEVKWYLQGADSGDGKSFMDELDSIQKDGSVSLEEWTKYFDDKGGAAEMFLLSLEQIVVKATLEEQKSAQMIQARHRGRSTRKGALVGAPNTEGKSVDDRVKECFSKFDDDDSGSLDIEELKHYLGSEEGAEDMMKQFDNIHTDGKIDLEEFQKYFKETCDQSLVNVYLQTLENMVLTGVSPTKAATAIQAKLRGNNARKDSKSEGGEEK